MAPVHHVKIISSVSKHRKALYIRTFMDVYVTNNWNQKYTSWGWYVYIWISRFTELHWLFHRATTRDCQFSIFQIELLMIEFEKCGSIITVHRITLLCVCTIFHGGQRLFANCCKTLPLKAPTHCTITAILSVHCMSLCARWVNIRGVLCDPCTVINSHPARARLRLKCSWGIF